uniref:Uncharacterized protein n=1 Tax=Siphoviridae sp. ctrpg19 TaxID=2826481 RepID=A0A8S5MK62_9CAUD|nr:MAG TPA: hypothetical protein [Siphoviridae sp. ctrpg19]
MLDVDLLLVLHYIEVSDNRILLAIHTLKLLLMLIYYIIELLCKYKQCSLIDCYCLLFFSLQLLYKVDLLHLDYSLPLI